MDEFAIRKGHHYATVVIDPTTKHVLWIGLGRKREDIRPFFELLGEAGCRRIEAVSMDMSTAYEEEVKANCPQAHIAYDLLHVVAKCGREVIDRVRVDVANRLRDDRPARKIDDPMLTLESALSLAEANLGDHHEATLDAISSLGSICRKSNELDDAKRYFRTAVERSRSSIGSDHIETVNRIKSLGLLLHLQ